ncbi:MAG: hypothetical protein IPL73_00260 [Candidatus Obscuribacter sp.]|nr:hypothetical protein [Candidatus Obscuribacter sp.]
MAKKIIELNNGRVKRTGNRIGGDRSSSESVGRRNGNAGYMARLQRFADEQSASDIADALAGGYESAPVPAVALARASPAVTPRASTSATSSRTPTWSTAAAVRSSSRPRATTAAASSTSRWARAVACSRRS